MLRDRNQNEADALVDLAQRLVRSRPDIRMAVHSLAGIVERMADLARRRTECRQSREANVRFLD
jgi:hypothetical protein